MKLKFRALLGLIAALILVGCALKEKKEKGSTVETTPKLKNFERVKPPLLLTDAKEQAAYLINHYWDHFDFRDTMYCHAPEITEQAFVDFIYLFPMASYNKVTEGVKKLLDSAEISVVMYNYFLKNAEHYLYEPNSVMRNDEYYIPFVEHVVASKKVMEDHKIRYKQILQLAYRNRPGSKAEDIVYTTATGQTGRLYNISAPYVLLMFFNPDCTECKVTTSQLKSNSAIYSAYSSGRVKVLAIYPDEDLNIWRQYLKDIPASWINGYDKDLKIRNSMTYDLKAIPTLLLLDKNKNVILKDAFIQAIADYLEKNP